MVHFTKVVDIQSLLFFTGQEIPSGSLLRATIQGFFSHIHTIALCFNFKMKAYYLKHFVLKRTLTKPIAR